MSCAVEPPPSMWVLRKEGRFFNAREEGPWIGGVWKHTTASILTRDEAYEAWVAFDRECEQVRVA